MRDFKNGVHLCERVSEKTISKNKDILNKIIPPPKKIALSCSVIITLSMLPHAAIAEDVAKEGSGKNAYTIGKNTEATKNDSTSIGHGASTSEEYSTALGSHASATRQYTADLNKKIKKELPSGTGFHDGFYVSRHQFGEVSVGGISSDDDNSMNKLDKYSQITHVAPGTDDTDAVNLFQTKNIVKGEVGKLQLGVISAHKEEVDKLKNEVSNVKQEIHQHKKRAEELSQGTEEYQNTVSTIIAKLQNNTANLNKTINQDNDGTMHIGKTLEGTTLSVAGNQGNRVISGVAAGINNNDAANMDQLNRVRNMATSSHAMTQKNTARINNLEHQLSKTNTKIGRGLAASAALTGLFQPYGVGNVNFTAGMGGYGSSQAIAVGSGYRINENTAVKAGLAYSGGNNVMYNASFNLEW